MDWVRCELVCAMPLTGATTMESDPAFFRKPVRGEMQRSLVAVMMAISAGATWPSAAMSQGQQVGKASVTSVTAAVRISAKADTLVRRGSPVDSAWARDLYIESAAAF